MCSVAVVVSLGVRDATLLALKQSNKPESFCAAQSALRLRLSHLNLLCAGITGRCFLASQEIGASLWGK